MRSQTSRGEAHCGQELYVSVSLCLCVFVCIHTHAQTRAHTHRSHTGHSAPSSSLCLTSLLLSLHLLLIKSDMLNWSSPHLGREGV